MMRLIEALDYTDIDWVNRLLSEHDDRARRVAELEAEQSRTFDRLCAAQNERNDTVRWYEEKCDTHITRSEEAEAERDNLRAEVEQLRGLMALRNWGRRREVADLRGLADHQAKLLAELPPSADELIMAEMAAACAKTETRVVEGECDDLRSKLKILQYDYDMMCSRYKTCQTCFGDVILERDTLTARVAELEEKLRQSKLLADALASAATSMQDDVLQLREYEAIVERDRPVEAFFMLPKVMRECRAANARAEAAERERDEARDHLRVHEDLRAGMDETVALNVSRDTAEEIAGWLAAHENESGEPCFPHPATLAHQVRAGAWRKKAGE